MNRLEMAQKLFNNPKLRATESRFDGLWHCYDSINGLKIIRNEKTLDTLILAIDENEDWQIIEPPKKLKQMSYGEVAYHFENSSPPIPLISIKSTLTGKTWTHDLTLEECKGLWTIDGIYEEVEEE